MWALLEKIQRVKQAALDSHLHLKNTQANSKAGADEWRDFMGRIGRMHYAVPAERLHRKAGALRITRMPKRI